MWDRTFTDTFRRSGLRIAAFALSVVALAAPASAQLDPLLPYKRVPPNVIVIMDTSFRMLDDGQGNYYDPKVYPNAGDAVANALNVPSTAAAYRRIYDNLRFATAQDSEQKYEANGIAVVPSTSSHFAADRFFAATRYWIALKGVRQAVSENPAGVRWGLMKLPQTTPAWRIGTDCDKPVEIAAYPGVTDSVACQGAPAGKFGVFAPSVAGTNSTALATTAVSVATGTATSSAQLRDRLDPTGIGTTAALIPAGRDTATVEDRPLLATLTEAKAEVARAIGTDTACPACRNTIVVLVVGGSDAAASDALMRAKATEFFSVSAGGTARRVPIYVVAVKVPDTARTQLQAIADNSGGRYFDASSIANVTRAVNLAVQAGYASWNDFTSGRGTEHLPVSAVVGTVNMKNARDRTGGTLDNTDIQSTAGVAIPQRSNLLLTAGFAIGGPSAGESGGAGFEGRLRAFRAQKPVADASKPGGWKFVQDGTPLWPTLDGRPATAGMARTPADPNRRNIYTWIPGGVVEFSLANAGALAPYLGGANPAELIPFVRNQPLGAVTNSTPAIMDPPSLDPPPDADYGRTDAPDTYAGDHHERRSIIWVGMNDGMMHAIDARTGYEVWAFVPHNLLPKLRALLDGQPVEQFTYFVDSSPKIAEVKMSGEWKTLMLFGQGWGGTFYQAFEVTEAGMGVAPDSDDWGAVLATFANTTRVRYLWSFPDYSSFDTTYDSGTLALADGTPGGAIRFFGDLRASATAVEKSVGFTWSDPAVGPLNADRTVNVVIAGSGYFPPVEDLLPGRGAGAPRAGRSVFALDAANGRPLGNPGSCPTTSSRGCFDLGDLNNPSRKNAVQADPTAAANLNSSVVNRFYIGDTDGRYYRFNIDNAGLMSQAWSFTTSGSQPVYSSSALLQIGTTEQYVFFSTGSDLLAATPVTAGGVGPLRLYGLRDNTTSTLTQLNFPLTWSACSTRAGVTTCSGADERPSTSPSVAGDIVFFTTTSEPAAAPCSDFMAKLYAFTYKGTAAYDTDGSGAITNNESKLIKTLAGRASAPFIVDQHLYFTTSGSQAGANVEVFGDPEDFNNGVGQVGVRILSWREVR